MILFVQRFELISPLWCVGVPGIDVCVPLQVMAHSTPQGILDDVAMVSSPC